MTAPRALVLTDVESGEVKFLTGSQAEQVWNHELAMTPTEFSHVDAYMRDNDGRGTE